MSKPVELLKEKINNIEVKGETVKTESYDLETLTDGVWIGSLKLIQQPLGVDVIFSAGRLPSNEHLDYDQDLDQALKDLPLPLSISQTSEVFRLIKQDVVYQIGVGVDTWNSGDSTKMMFGLVSADCDDPSNTEVRLSINAYTNDLSKVGFCVRGFIPDATLN